MKIDEKNVRGMYNDKLNFNALCCPEYFYNDFQDLNFYFCASPKLRFPLCLQFGEESVDNIIFYVDPCISYNLL